MAIFWTSVQSVLEIVLMIAVGYICQRLGWFVDGFSKSISKLIMQVALPASIFMSMLDRFKISQLAQLSPGIVFVVISIFLGYVVAYMEMVIFKIRPERKGVFLAAVNGTNTVFIGLPLNVALFGDVSIPYLLVYYIVNTIVIWTFGVWVIAWFDPQQKGAVKIDLKHFLPAPLWGFIVAIPFLIWMPKAATQLPTFITTVLADVGGLVTPLSLVYIGIMLAKFGLSSIRIERDLNLALLGRFVIAPALTALIIFVAAKCGVSIAPMFSKTLIIQSATPAFAVLPVLAGQYHSDVEYTTNVVVATSVLFVVVVPVIMMLV